MPRKAPDLQDVAEEEENEAKEHRVESRELSRIRQRSRGRSTYGALVCRSLARVVSSLIPEGWISIQGYLLVSFPLY